MNLEATYQCPGETYEISHSVHLSRLAGFYRACGECPHRGDTRLVSPRRAKQLGDFHGGAACSRPIVRNEGLAGVYLNEIGPELAGRIGRAFGLSMESNAAEADADAPLVFVAHDGRTEAAELAAEAIDGLRWAGCSVVDLGPATAPCLTATALTRGAKGSLLVGSLSDEPHEVAFSFWGPVGKPLSGPGLAPLERLLPSPAPRPRRSSGGYKRVSAAGEYLSQFSEYFHALRPLRLVINTSSLAIRGYLERLTSSVALEVEWRHGGSAGIDRTAARVRATGAHFGAWIDGCGEFCRVIDERGELVEIDALLALLHDEVKMAGAKVECRRVSEPSTRQATWQSLRGQDNVLADADGRIWFPGPLPCPDALKTLTLLLTLLSRGDRPLSELAASAIL